MHTHRRRGELKQQPTKLSQFTLPITVRVSGRRADAKFGCTRNKPISIYVSLTIGEHESFDIRFFRSTLKKSYITLREFLNSHELVA